MPRARIDVFPLRCLEAAARLGSLSAAARELAVSQPAVSVQIAALERDLGVVLLVRDVRGVRPTPSGEEILRSARRVMAEMESLEGTLHRGPLRGSLRIGATDVVMIHRLPKVLRSFRREHPEVELTFLVEGSETLAQAVRGREIEIALVTLPLRDPPGQVRVLYRDRMVFVTSPGSDLARRKRLTLAHLAGAPLLGHKSGSVTRTIVEGAFTARGLLPRFAMEISSPEVLRQMARSGLGVAVLPEASVHEDVRRGHLAILPVSGWDLTRTSGLLVPHGGPVSRAARRFVGMLPEGLPEG